MYNIVIMSTVLHVKLDQKLKDEAQETARALGLPLSTVVAANLREFVKTRSVTISDLPRLNVQTAKILKARSDDVSVGKNVSPSFKSIDDAKKWLNA